MFSGNHAVAGAVNAKLGALLPCCLLLWGLLGAGPAAWGAPPSTPPATINAMRAELEQSAASERSWANHWGTIWSVAAVGQGIAAAVVQYKPTRIDLAYGAGSSVMGLVPTWIRQPRAMVLWRQALSEGKDHDPEWLRQALEEDRNDKAMRRGWLAHVGNVAFNVALGSVQAFVIGHRRSGLITTLVGIPFGIAMIETQPHPAIRKWEAMIAPTEGGAAVAAAFRW